MRTKFGFVSVALLALLLMPQPSSFAQVQTTTGITGTVRDATGAVVPGVEVTATDQDTGQVRRAVTNDVGFYTFQSLKPGTYTIQASLAGFKTFVLQDRQILVAIPAQVNITLEIGELTDTVTVSGVGEELVNKTTAELSTTINQNLVQNLPNETRNYFDLLALSPNTSPQYLSMGSVSYPQHSIRRVNAANSFESAGVYAAGERDSASNVSVDGANSQIANYNQTVTIISSSAIRELRLQTASANAEFGFGSNAVNVITKSGTNSLHGEAFWQHRNDNLDAVGFFTNLAGNVLPEYKRNKFGASIGGPIVKDKLLFFFNYESSRLRQAVQQNARTPTALERSGDFSQTRMYGVGNVLLEPRPIFNPYDYDPATGLRRPFPNNKIPSTMLDPAIQVALKYTPLPNIANLDGVQQYSGLNRTEMNENQYNTRIDWQKSDKSLIYGRWSWSERKARLFGLMPPLQGESTPASSKTAVVNWNQVINPRMINDVSLSYSRPKWGIGRPINVPDVSTEMGLKNMSTLGGSPGLSATDFSIASSGSFVWDPTQNTYQGKEDFSFTVGHHAFKTGLHFIDRRLYYLIASGDKGRFTFEQTYTSACPLGNAKCEAAAAAAGYPAHDLTGHAMADMVLGAARLVDLQLRGVDWHGQQKYWGGYFQDTWQVARKLTLNMGLRYEYWRPWTLPRNTAATIDLSGEGKIVYALQNPLDAYNPATEFGRNAPLNPAIPRQGYETGKKNFAPRLGFAFAISPDTSLNVAGGIFFAGNINANQMSDQMSGAPPFTLQGGQTTARTEQLPPIIVKNSFDVPKITTIPKAYDTPLPAARLLPQRFFPSPTVYQWTLSLQHRFNPSWAMNFDYIGSHTIHNQQWIQFNPGALPQGPLANLSLQERRKLKGWAAIDAWVPWGWQKYHSGTVGIKNREWKGLFFMSNFTWAKALSTSTSLIGNDLSNWHVDYWDLWHGRTNFIPDLRSISAWSYNLPFGSKMTYKLSGVADAIAGGWVISGITEFTTGAPVNVNYSDNSGTGTGYQQADRVPGCDLYDAPGDRFQYFNTKCFTIPAFGTWGNSAANPLNAGGINNWNITIKKMFTLREEHRIEFRTEMFNAFNVTQWGNPTTSLASSSFGRMGGTRPARQLQFSLFYTF